MDPFSNPVEMGLRDRAAVAGKIASLADYREWFPMTQGQTLASLTGRWPMPLRSIYEASLYSPRVTSG